MEYRFIWIYHIITMILQRDFYTRDPMTVTRELVGAYLCRAMPDGRIIRAKIAEVELYHQCERGCHAFGGRRTARNDAMFMAGGHAYVYLCYGLHHMLNIVVGDEGIATAALVRAVECDAGNGPGKLCRVLNITRAENKLDLTRGIDMWIEAADCAPRKIISAPRIGIDYAGADASRPWRFGDAESKYLSRPFN